GNRAAALRAIDEAAALDAPDDLVAAVDREKQRVLVYLFVRDYQAAVDASIHAVALARASGLRYALASTLHNVGDARWRLGDLARSYAALTESKEIAESLAHERLTTLNRIHLSYIDGIRGVPGAEKMLGDLVNDVDNRGYVTDPLEGRLLLGLLHKH